MINYITLYFFFIFLNILIFFILEVIYIIYSLI